MISFKQFLSEASVEPMAPPIPLTREEILPFLKKHCSIALENAQYGENSLYRGFKHSIEMGVYDPSSGTRSSENTSNWYTSFFDTNPENSAWPKRSKSFICTTDNERALSYAEDHESNVGLILPFDGVRVGEIMSDDLWHVKPVNPFMINRGYPAFNRLYGLIFKDQSPLSFDEALNGLETVDEEQLIDGFTRYMDTAAASMPDWANSAIEHPDQLRTMLKNFTKQVYTFDAQRSFKLHLNSASLKPEHECWFAGKCVVIPLHLTDVLDPV